MLSTTSRYPESASGRAPAVANEDAGRLIAVHPDTERKLAANIDPRWGRFLEVWRTITREKARLPARTDLDPTRIGTELLPNLFIADVLRGGKPALRFRFRLLGQAILDRETTRPGAFLDELGASADIAEIELHYRACLECKVYLREASLVWNDVRKDSFTYGVLVLPLSDDGVTVTHLLGLSIYSF